MLLPAHESAALFPFVLKDIVGGWKARDSILENSWREIDSQSYVRKLPAANSRRSKRKQKNYHEAGVRRAVKGAV